MKHFLFILSLMLPTIIRAQDLSNCSFGFIGDSQVAQTQGAMPIAVAEDLGVAMDFYGQTSAHARHYLNTASPLTKHIGFSNEESINARNSCDAYTYFLDKRPDYMIIALGHNGTTDLQKLIDGIKANGSSTILVKMFPIGKIPDMKKPYNGITADIVVDLTDFTVDTRRDGIHPPKDEMTRVGHEIARQLKQYFAENGTIHSHGKASADSYVKARYGDTLETIAKANGLAEADIYRLNPHMKEVPFNYQLRTNEMVRVK